MARGRTDFSPTAVDVVLRPEWAAKEGHDKVLAGSSVDVARGGPVVAQISYIVPTGRTLYIHAFSFFSYANLDADGDLNQICSSFIMNFSVGAFFSYIGGNGGGGISLAKPAVIPAGQRFAAKVTNRANHNCDMGITAWGYEEY